MNDTMSVWEDDFLCAVHYAFVGYCYVQYGFYFFIAQGLN